MNSASKKMRGLRNICVVEYVVIDDKLAFKAINTRLKGSYKRFKKLILDA
jgi:uncharacterized protein with HEPN domain